MVKPVTVKIDDALWRKFKDAAKKRRVLLMAAVEEALKRELKRAA